MVWTHYIHPIQILPNCPQTLGECHAVDASSSTNVWIAANNPYGVVDDNSLSGWGSSVTFYIWDGSAFRTIIYNPFDSGEPLHIGIAIWCVGLKVFAPNDVWAVFQGAPNGTLETHAPFLWHIAHWNGTLWDKTQGNMDNGHPDNPFDIGLAGLVSTNMYAIQSSTLQDIHIVYEDVMRFTTSWGREHVPVGTVPSIFFPPSYLVRGEYDLNNGGHGTNQSGPKAAMGGDGFVYGMFHTLHGVGTSVYRLNQLGSSRVIDPLSPLPGQSDGATYRFQGICQDSPTSMYLFGDDISFDGEDNAVSCPVIVHGYGFSWEVVVDHGNIPPAYAGNPGTLTVYAMSALSPTEYALCGNCDGLVVDTHIGGVWSHYSFGVATYPGDPSGYGLFGIKYLSATNIWVVGGFFCGGPSYPGGDHLIHTLVLHWDGSGWTEIHLPYVAVPPHN